MRSVRNLSFAVLVAVALWTPQLQARDPECQDAFFWDHTYASEEEACHAVELWSCADYCNALNCDEQAPAYTPGCEGWCGPAENESTMLCVQTHQSPPPDNWEVEGWCACTRPNGGEGN